MSGYTVQGTVGYIESYLEWYPQFRFPQEDPQILETVQPSLENIVVPDSGRSWAASTQQIGLNFSEAMAGDATGWSMTVNGTNAPLTYVSGSGTTQWIFSAAALFHHGDIIKITYNPTTGNTISVTGSVEIKSWTAVIQSDQLTKRIRFILCDSMDAVVNAGSVKAAIDEYASATVANDTWMQRANKATVVTSAAGQFDMEYTGTASVNGTVYISVVEIPTTNPSGIPDNLIVAATVV